MLKSSWRIVILNLIQDPRSQTKDLPRFPAKMSPEIYEARRYSNEDMDEYRRR